MLKTVLFESVFKDMKVFEEKTAGLSELAVLDFTPESVKSDEVKNCDVLLIANQRKADKELIDTLKNCRLIIRCGVGYENVDIDYAAKKGIYVANAPAYCDDEVSDHAVAMLLAMERRLISSDADIRCARKFRLDTVRGIGGLRGRTAGIIGLGATGRLTAKKLTAFGMNILYYHPRRREDEAGDGYFARWVELDDIYRQSDYVILHATSTPETYHITDEHAFSLMKPTAGLINVARGELVDTAALNKALDDHCIACAALDVFEGPLDSRDNRELFEKDGTILTPHSAWLSDNAEKKLLSIMADNVIDICEGRVPRNCVNFNEIKMNEK